MDELLKNNIVELTGEFASDFVLDHTSGKDNFYKSYLKIMRTSGIFDFVPIMVSDRLFDVKCRNIVGFSATVKGQFRSHNKHIANKNRLELFVFAKEFLNIAEEENLNYIYLNGFICKEPVYRTTPLGREIADLLIAVNRPYGKSDYIPCIVWNENAKYISQFGTGTRIALDGRIQSREYLKRLDDGTSETRTVYEVSGSTIEVIENTEV